MMEEEEIGNFTSLGDAESLPLILDPNYSYAFMKWTILLIGCAFNVVIVHIIRGVDKMRSTTNVFLANWCINDILFAISTTMTDSYSTTITLAEVCIQHNRQTVSCMFYDLHFAFMLLSVIFITIIVNLTAMQNVAIILGVTYAFCFIWCIVDIAAWLIGQSIHIIIITLMIAEISLLIVIIKRRHPTNDKSRKRLKIGQIFLYNWLIYQVIEISASLVGYTLIIIYIISFTRFLTSLYIFIYLCKTDNQFSMCAVNLLKCNLASAEFQASLTPEKDFDDEICDNMNSNTYKPDYIAAV